MKLNVTPTLSTDNRTNKSSKLSLSASGSDKQTVILTKRTKFTTVAHENVLKTGVTIAKLDTL
jgi:hypothetical protein